MKMTHEKTGMSSVPIERLKQVLAKELGIYPESLKTVKFEHETPDRIRTVYRVTYDHVENSVVFS